ncbi:phosphoglycolate phosphatase [Rhabdochromatium marinum]|uniref:phosphoglycolate phosphatase n=1 Tax=Rhabdochromatium marinum TaxID=48729 RepID=UPI001903EA65|nr:phosphoglycolate phosphatase [Rhabdochromatium marinum]MBK1649422.1 phosphoglycolate phosphatase [Rhabdochromatium marinum]
MPERFRPGLVLLDLDGTLVDSVPDLTYCVDQMMLQLGRSPCGEAAVRTWVGNGVERLVSRALAGSLDGRPNAEDYARGYPMFVELYTQHTYEHSVLYPGVREGLRWLVAQGYRLGCVTNKAGGFTEPLLAHFDLRGWFEIVISGDTLPEKKPSPMPLLHAAEHFGVAPEQALMVGDSISDVKAARAAGFWIACMSYGYNHGEDIRDAQPDVVLDALPELAGLLAGSAAPPSGA